MERDLKRGSSLKPSRHLVRSQEINESNAHLLDGDSAGKAIRADFFFEEKIPRVLPTGDVPDAKPFIFVATHTKVGQILSGHLAGMCWGCEARANNKGKEQPSYGGQGKLSEKAMYSASAAGI